MRGLVEAEGVAAVDLGSLDGAAAQILSGGRVAVGQLELVVGGGQAERGAALHHKLHVLRHSHTTQINAAMW